MNRTLTYTLCILFLVMFAPGAYATNWAYTTVNSVRFWDDQGNSYEWSYGNVSFKGTNGLEISSFQTSTAGAEVIFTVNAASVNDEKVKVSANDTTADYLFAQVLAGARGLTITEENDGADEYVLFDMDATYTDISGNDGSTDVSGAELETLTDGSDAVGLHEHLLNDIGNPDGNAAFNMTTRQIKFSYTNPAVADGGFEIEASGAFSGDLVHVHQHTGNPSTVDLMDLEASDTDVLPLRVTAGSNSTTSISTTGPIQMSDGNEASGQFLADSGAGSGIAAWTTPNYAFITAGDAGTDVTAAELEELTDGSTTTLHAHAVQWSDLTETEVPISALSAVQIAGPAYTTNPWDVHCIVHFRVVNNGKSWGGRYPLPVADGLYWYWEDEDDDGDWEITIVNDSQINILVTVGYVDLG